MMEVMACGVTRKKESAAKQTERMGSERARVCATVSSVPWLLARRWQMLPYVTNTKEESAQIWQLLPPFGMT